MHTALGCRKDPKDLRDIPMSIVLPPITLPPALDYRRAMTPVRNQGNEGTCVAFASVVGVKEFEDQKEYRKLIKLSPRYVYTFCKKFDGAPEEEGTYPRIALKMLLKYGVCPEFFWPYHPFQTDKPRKGADTKAKVYCIKAYARLKSVTEMKRSLAINGPFLAGVEVFENWFSRSVNKTGRIPLPTKGEESVGGHAICITGYNDVKKVFVFKNSWGIVWGDKGYGYLDYDYLRRYCMDAWSATDLIANPKALVKKIEEVLKRFA
jgi:C1A family cysteine protease